jgi:hypothetical protein
LSVAKSLDSSKASGPQLWKLNAAGLLELRERPGPRVLFGEAYEVVAALKAAEPKS